MSEYIKSYRARNTFVKKLEKPENAVNDNIEYGSLEVSVHNFINNEPVEYAEVGISLLTVSGLYNEKGEGRLIATANTDSSGNTPLINLPAINKISRSEGNNVGKIYILTVRKEGYFSAYVFDVQIYANITTSYLVNLKPVRSGENPRSQYEFILEPNIKNPIKK